MVRTRGRIDANQPLIVKALELGGCTVKSTAALGHGFPDLAVGLRGQNFFLEVKDPSAKPSKRRLTPDEKEWHQLWRGQVDVVETPEDALRAVGLLI